MSTSERKSNLPQNHLGWLLLVRDMVRPYLEDQKLHVPPNEKLRFMRCLPKRGRNKGGDELPRFGELFWPEESTDGCFHLGISPEAPDEQSMILTVILLLIDAGVPQVPGRSSRLRDAQRDAGFKGPIRHPIPDKDRLNNKIKEIAATLPPFPDGKITPLTRRVQATRMLRSTCRGETNGQPCGFGPIRVSAEKAKWVACAIHGPDLIVVEPQKKPDDGSSGSAPAAAPETPPTPPIAGGGGAETLPEQAEELREAAD